MSGNASTSFNREDPEPSSVILIWKQERFTFRSIALPDVGVLHLWQKKPYDDRKAQVFFQPRKPTSGMALLVATVNPSTLAHTTSSFQCLEGAEKDVIFTLSLFRGYANGWYLKADSTLGRNSSHTWRREPNMPFNIGQVQRDESSPVPSFMVISPQDRKPPSSP